MIQVAAFISAIGFIVVAAIIGGLIGAFLWAVTSGLLLGIFKTRLGKKIWENWMWTFVALTGALAAIATGFAMDIYL